MNFVLVYGFRSSHWHLPDLSHSYWTDKHLGRAAILNKINFASLIPTNAAIHRLLAPKSLLFEFVLRREQGHDGAVTASKYAVLRCFGYTSNCVAAKLHNYFLRDPYPIPSLPHLFRLTKLNVKFLRTAWFFDRKEKWDNERRQIILKLSTRVMSMHLSMTNGKFIE